MKKGSGNILIISLVSVVIVCVLVITGIIFFSGEGQFDILSSFQGGSVVSLAETNKQNAQEFFELFDKINSLKLEAGIFNNNTFRNLVDFSTTPQTRPTGATNPFSTL